MAVSSTAKSSPRPNGLRISPESPSRKERALRKTSSFIRIAVVTLLTIVLQLIDLTPALPPIAPSDAGTTIQLRAKSTILFTDSPDGTRRSTKRLWVPYGG